MNICGLLIHAQPARHNEVRAALEAMAGVEVHSITEDGRLVVTVEDGPGVDTGDQVLAIHRLPGVIAAALVYHHFEADQESEDDPVAA